MTLIDDIRADLQSSAAFTDNALAVLDALEQIVAPPDFDWTAVSAPNGAWHFIDWSPTLKVWAACASFDNTIMVLSPGGAWQGVSAPALEYKGMCWCGDRFVAVSKTGTVVYSDTSDVFAPWLTSSAANANQWHDIAYSPVRDVAVAVAQEGSTERFMVSTDRGLTWTGIVPPSPANSWQAVDYSMEQDLFVAVAQFGDNIRVATSRDGIVWEGHAAPQKNWKSVAFGNGRWFAVSSDDSFMWSRDGKTWVESATVAGLWHDVDIGAGAFFAVSQVGANQIVASVTGEDLTVVAAPSGAWQGISYAPEFDTFAVVGQGGDAMIGTRSQTQPPPPPPGQGYSGTPYRYWELKVTANHGGTRVRIGEMEMIVAGTPYPLQPMTGHNLPAPYAASATSEDGPRDPWRAFDKAVGGNPEQEWWSTGAPPQSLYIDLGELITPDQLRLTATSAQTQHSGKDFELIGHDTATFDGASETALTVTGEMPWSGAEVRNYTIATA